MSILLDFGFLAFITTFILFIIIKGTYQVSQAEVIVIERFGKFHSILDSGIHFTVPFMDAPRIVHWTFFKQEANSKRYYSYIQSDYRIDLRETTYDFPRQNVITKDNVTMEINALLYYQITDPVRAVYEINNLSLAIEKLTQTTLRDVIGYMDLDETLISREAINHKLRIRLDEATDKWGVKINRVELQEINPPHDIQVAMEKQMKAERDRRAHILEAEGLKRAQILEAEGYRQSKLERAEGEAQAQLALARAEAEAKLLLAKAEADSINFIKQSLPDANPANYVIATKYIKAFSEAMADSKGKTIVVPYEAAGFAGATTALREILNTNIQK
ncbi:SPFH/Band 7/PHB domain protein [Candidatus Dependentiae bacterium]|nr:SPFH/Band 7/PHB domain protein [Candidatus Dependentiae bacterium]